MATKDCPSIPVAGQDGALSTPESRRRRILDHWACLPQMSGAMLAQQGAPPANGCQGHLAAPPNGYLPERVHRHQAGY